MRLSVAIVFILMSLRMSAGTSATGINLALCSIGTLGSCAHNFQSKLMMVPSTTSRIFWVGQNLHVL